MKDEFWIKLIFFDNKEQRIFNLFTFGK